MESLNLDQHSLTTFTSDGSGSSGTNTSRWQENPPTVYGADCRSLQLSDLKKGYVVDLYKKGDTLIAVQRIR